MRVPGREIDGQLVSHPPEFYQAEREIAPERERSWDWIWRNLGPWLEERTKLEQIKFLRKPVQLLTAR
ncbi:hypothetical protein HG15A2_09610 [Adhaeretor mobilis]|uniref:Uncharacterized protein n=1 Tax=Adhaeretor mobilis TaxID=1930276 RepID=A0A517MSC9_9BACT|nr:hypothetical protein HG15A2_09610 [Adhaeretor mobilis]